MKKTNSVKEMLTLGTTPEDLLNSLREEIEKAQAEIDAENAKTSDLANAREEAAQAFYNYLIALDVIPEIDINEAAEFINEITELLKSMEDQIKAYAAVINFATGLGLEPASATRGKRAEVCKCKEMTPADEEVIREFLKSLR